MSVIVTGMGIISAIGNNVQENHHALQLIHTGIKPSANYFFNSGDAALLGEVILSNIELQRELETPTLQSRTSLLALKAAKEAIIHAQLTSEELANAALISGITVGGMDISEKELSHFYAKDYVSKAFIEHPCAFSTQNMATHFGINGYCNTISTACSSAANAILLGKKLIESGQTNIAIVGGVDALTQFTFKGFESLLLLDSKLNQPFDTSRKGLNLGEGAAYLILEKKGFRENQPKALAELLSGANQNDAYHQTASSPQGKGAYLAMKTTLERANIQPKQVDYINAHGTATQNNDDTELAALIALFGDFIPDFSSTKNYTGHTLAACGAIEAIYALLMLENQTIYPTFSTITPTHKSLITTLKSKPLNYILSNSFGFGGNCTSLLFKKL